MKVILLDTVKENFLHQLYTCSMHANFLDGNRNYDHVEKTIKYNAQVDVETKL